MKIIIPNQRLWQISEDGENIDVWLIKEVGYGNWKEWIGITNLPYRTFEIENEELAILFQLRWM